MTAVEKMTSLRSDAARYGNAVRAIGDIASMTLSTADQIRAALAILDRESSNLKFQASRAVVQVLNDPGFVASVKRAAPNATAAEALAREYRATPQAVWKGNVGSQNQPFVHRQSVAPSKTTCHKNCEYRHHTDVDDVE